MVKAKVHAKAKAKAMLMRTHKKFDQVAVAMEKPQMGLFQEDRRLEPILSVIGPLERYQFGTI